MVYLYTLIKTLFDIVKFIIEFIIFIFYTAYIECLSIIIIKAYKIFKNNLNQYKGVRG